MYRYVKRALDIILSLAGLLAGLPLLAAVSVAVAVDSNGPVVFKQKRVGIHKRCFYIYKFRTMRTDAPKDCPTHLLVRPDAYMTRAGKFLRKTSLDELPQLINILLGQMSFVGPRPALWNQYDLIEAREQYSANSVRPGLTGFAQINGRDELSIAEKARMDGMYVRMMCFREDLKCILATIGYVIRQKNIRMGNQR